MPSRILVSAIVICLMASKAIAQRLMLSPTPFVDYTYDNMKVIGQDSGGFFLNMEARMITRSIRHRTTSGVPSTAHRCRSAHLTIREALSATIRCFRRDRTETAKADGRVWWGRGSCSNSWSWLDRALKSMGMNSSDARRFRSVSSSFFVSCWAG